MGSTGPNVRLIRLVDRSGSGDPRGLDPLTWDRLMLLLFKYSSGHVGCGSTQWGRADAYVQHRNEEAPGSSSAFALSACDSDHARG